MTQFEAYLIRLKMACRKQGYEEEYQIVNTIHEQYLKLQREPDLTAQEQFTLQREFKEYVFERRKNRD